MLLNASNQMKTAKLNKLGQTKRNPDEKFKEMAEGYFIFVSYFGLSFKRPKNIKHLRLNITD